MAPSAQLSTFKSLLGTSLDLVKPSVVSLGLFNHHGPFPSATWQKPRFSAQLRQTPHLPVHRLLRAVFDRSLDSAKGQLSEVPVAAASPVLIPTSASALSTPVVSVTSSARLPARRIASTNVRSRLSLPTDGSADTVSHRPQSSFKSSRRYSARVRPIRIHSPTDLTEDDIKDILIFDAQAPAVRPDARLDSYLYGRRRPRQTFQPDPWGEPETAIKTFPLHKYYLLTNFCGQRSQTWREELEQVIENKAIARREDKEKNRKGKRGYIVGRGAQQFGSVRFEGEPEGKKEGFLVGEMWVPFSQEDGSTGVVGVGSDRVFFVGF